MTSRTEIDTDVLDDHIKAVLNWADAETLASVSDETIIQAALARADVDPGDVIIITDFDDEDTPPLSERVKPADEHRERLELFAEFAAAAISELRERYGYDTIELCVWTTMRFVCRSSTRFALGASSRRTANAR